MVPQISLTSQSGRRSVSRTVMETSGPWPFVTRLVLREANGALAVLHSRHHRKNLLLDHSEVEGRSLRQCLWMPRQLNWWIGSVFALGSSLFALGSILTLAPELASAWALDATAINAVFFAGSIPFTTAAYLQLYQAANAPGFATQDKPKKKSRKWLGWRPRDIGWLSSALQFVGTLLFNRSTYNAMLPGLDWIQQDRLIWLPDIMGSILFLASGYLAFIEISHAYWTWSPRSLSWWVTFSNLLGCVAFMISAIFAYVPQHLPAGDAATLSVIFTLLGAIGFLVGSLLMLPETLRTKS